MNGPARPPGGSPTASSSAPDGPAPDAPASQPAEPPEEKTQPHNLRDVAARLAKQRRRGLAAELVVKRPKVAEVRVPIDRSETVIGRDPGCDIVLPEEAVSLKHARIQRSEGGFFEVVDLDSTNGIVVNGEILTRMILQDGDSFVVGETRFTIAIAPVVGS